MQPPLDRELILELRSLLSLIHNDAGQHSVMVGLTQSVKDAKAKIKEAREGASAAGVAVALLR